MLVHLRVQNMALIDEVSVDLGEGLNVLTGETGAGKSILLGAVSLALGARAAKGILRDPAKPAEVALLFAGEKPEVLAALSDLGIEAPDGDVLIVRRFTVNGRSLCQINDSMVTTQQVKAVADLLIDIHGQHEHQSLLDVGRHIDMLDRFIPEAETLKKELRALWDETGRLQKEYQHYAENEQEGQRLMGLLDYEIRQIEEVDWKEGEEENLQEERKRLIYSEKLQEGSMGAYYKLRGENGEGRPALEQMEDALAHIREIASYDSEFFDPYVNSLEEQIAVLDDIAAEMRRYGESMEAQPERLTEIEERLDQIGLLKNKYGRSREEVLAYAEKARADLEKWQHLEETMRALSEQIEKRQKAMGKLAARLSELRSEAGKRVEAEVTKVLETLQFEEPIFKIEQKEKELSPKGVDQITFMIRTNVGEALRPLHQIASGGEMSRVMLAIKTVLAEQDEIGTLIFDEIDTGISGRTAQSVAEKMSRIARYHQVICVTHLPQIAALADYHVRIEKTTDGQRTKTELALLSQEEMVEELARMLGGTEITAAVKENAAEMKKLANEWKGAAARS